MAVQHACVMYAPGSVYRLTAELAKIPALIITRGCVRHVHVREELYVYTILNMAASPWKKAMEGDEEEASNVLHLVTCVTLLLYSHRKTILWRN